MAEQGTSSDEAPNDAADGPDETGAESLPSVESPTSGLDQEEFETPSSRYLGLFGTVGALVGLAIGIQQGSAAFGMAVGLALGIGLGLLLNLLAGR